MSESSETQNSEASSTTGALPESREASQNEEKREHKRRDLTREYFRLGAGLCGALVCCVLLAYVIDVRLANGRIMRSVSMSGVELSRLTIQEAENRLLELDRRLRSTTVRLGVRREVCTINAERVAFRLDKTRSATRAFAVGRDGNALDKFGGFLARLFKQAELLPVVSLERAKLSELVHECETKAIADAPFQGGVSVSGTEVREEYPRPGFGLDIEQVERAVLSAFTAQSRQIVQLEPVALSPRVSRAEVDRIVLEAKRALSAPLTLKSADQTKELHVSREQLGAVLTARVKSPTASELELAVLAAPLEKLLAPERTRLEDAPQDAKFVIDDKDHVSIQPSRSGTRLPLEDLQRAVLHAALDPNHSAELCFEPGAPPALTTEDAEKLGILGLVSSFTTRHACCEARVTNIHRMADLLNGVIVKPGQTFSVNELVGPRTTKNGFVPAPTIEEGEMVDSIGGGASQFATTLFNAIYFGGYDVVERQPHSYWFSRYPMGRDATLSFPKPDVIFRNDTEAGVLIKTEYTDTSITVKFYGNNGGRKVRDEVSARQNVVKPEVELISNPKLEPDREKVKDSGMIGWSVIVRRIISFPNGTTREDRRKVTYKPRIRRVEVHPCRIPEGEKGYTGDPCPEPEDVEITEPTSSR